MNRYPFWKYIVIAVALLFGAVYTAPNFFGEAPAVQVSSQRPTVKVDAGLLTRIESTLNAAGVPYEAAYVEMVGLNVTARVRLADTDTQIRARDALESALNPDPKDPTYVVALNLLSRSPRWLASAGALPMYLGLDLRGGVHFLMQVNTAEAVTKRLDALSGDLRTLLREKEVRHAGISRAGDRIEIRFREEEVRGKAVGVIRDTFATELALREDASGADLLLLATLSPAAAKTVADSALKQNINTLHNRINELGVAEPVIQQQGADRVVVQLPGVQDTARAKDIIGRTATLESRLVDLSAEAQAAVTGGAPVPFGSERFTIGRGAPVVLKKDIIFSGQQLQGAQATFDENQRPAVSIDLNESAGRHLRKVSRENIKKPMAIVLFEKGRGEVLTVATIQDELGSRFRITGLESSQMANDLALLLRAGALAAPMDIIEERTIGPSLGKENIDRGFRATAYGFLAIALFMIFYYRVFGLISVAALTVNLGLLVGLLSLLQATLTLPGIAAVALTLGMAIDANVLINERVREELRRGATAQQAITQGYEKAFATILDSNITTLIAGVFLFMLGSGPIRGFAVVHCLGILTSIFSAVFVSRGIVNLVYGSRRRLGSISVGQVWTGGKAADAKA
ncbi:MAG: protein translocase subunit SecD [Burkholderiales bacterium]|jgi:preprotein translocase subunit SecD|nr:protein translocase subunit SecD [Burkholderiales bacterium]